VLGKLVSWSALCIAALGCAAQTATEAATSAHDGARGVPDAIVVLGHRPPLTGAELEYETRARVDRGIELFRQGRAPRLLFSGGPSTPQAIEADVMASYAAARGVPAEALLRERASRDTIENARLSLALLRRELELSHVRSRADESGPSSLRRPRIVLVTSDYHLERASRLFRCAGAEVEGVSVPLAISRRAQRKKRRSERFVHFYYWFIDECGRAAGIEAG
jgi:uncharacterized SAM-binding protein YcdF (DUF218 family)